MWVARGKESACNAGAARDEGLIHGWGRSGSEHGNSLQCSCLENPMDRRTWHTTVRGVTKSKRRQKQLSTHACTYMYIYIGLLWWLSWQRICLKCRRLGINPWVRKILRRESLRTPVYLPGEFHRKKSLDIYIKYMYFIWIKTFSCIYIIKHFHVYIYIYIHTHIYICC